MFDKLKKKVAIRQSIIWGVVLSTVLFLVFMYNISSMYRGVERKLDEISSLKYNVFFEETDEDSATPTKSRDTMVIFIGREGRVFASDDIFDKETVMEIVSVILESDNNSGYLTIGDTRIAYRHSFVGQFGDAIYLCDFTEDFTSAVHTMLIIIAAGVIGMIAIALISVRWAKRNIAPVEDAFEKQQELVANASHELKTPITIINTDLSILGDSADNFTEEQKKWLDNIGSQVSRMGALVGEMLTLARIEANAHNSIKEEVDLSTLAEGVVLESEALLFENNITLDTDIKKGVFIFAEAKNIEKLIYILVENALKYTPEGGKLSVSVTSDRKRVVLKVRNTGTGIKKEDIPKLFDRFYRVDEAHSSATGFGLGLAIAKSIVDVSGGKIGVESVEGEYTEFIVLFREIAK